MVCILVIMGVAGYFMQKRRGPGAVRGFLIWYGFTWPLFGVALCGTSISGVRVPRSAPTETCRTWGYERVSV